MMHLRIFSFALLATATLNANNQPTNTLVDILLSSANTVVETGRVYVENTDQLTEKHALYECGSRFLSKFDSINKPDTAVLREYHACIKRTNIELSPNNPQFAGFEHWWYQLEQSDEDYSKRSWRNYMDSKLKFDVPHPLILIKKATEDMGKFAFVEKSDGDVSAPQARFVAVMKEAILLTLESSKYGEESFSEKMKAKLHALHELCKTQTVFHSLEKQNANQDEEIERLFSEQMLISIGQYIGSVFASCGGLLVLSEDDRVKLGTGIAELCNPTYTSLQKAQKEGKNAELKINDQVKLGDKIISEVEKVKLPAQLEDDYDAKLIAMQSIIAEIYTKKDMQASNTAKRAEYAENNPLTNAFKY